MDSRRSKVIQGALGKGAIAVGLMAAACSSGSHGSGDVDPSGEEGQIVAGNVSGTQKQTVLDERVKSYGDALRTASIKLTDKLPTLQQIRDLERSTTPAADYEQAIDEMFESGAFKRRMIRFARDTFRQGGSNLDSAPVFLARILVEGRPLGELFTAQSNNCPTFDSESESFVDGNCDNGAPVHAGVLTNPGTMKQFYSSMAFRRVRWVQEMFACSKFPAELSDTPIDMGAGQFTSPWEFDTVASSPIDFQDTSAVVCANCHTSMNHIAPLFANFDKDGMWQDTFSVTTPTTPDPTPTELSHWLRAGESFAWRMGAPVKDLAELGQALASDPEVHSCLVARLWNLTMSKEDIVSDFANVPQKVIQPFLDQLGENGGNLTDALKAMLKSDDFIKF
jgi:hypothetical protein